MKVDVSFCVPEWVYWQIEKARELRKLKIGSPALVRYPDLAQPRTIDLGHKVLQIHAGTREFKGGESKGQFVWQEAGVLDQRGKKPIEIEGQEF